MYLLVFHNQFHSYLKHKAGWAYKTCNINYDAVWLNLLCCFFCYFMEDCIQLILQFWLTITLPNICSHSDAFWERMIILLTRIIKPRSISIPFNSTHALKTTHKHTQHRGRRRPNHVATHPFDFILFPVSSAMILPDIFSFRNRLLGIVRSTATRVFVLRPREFLSGANATAYRYWLTQPRDQRGFTWLWYSARLPRRSLLFWKCWLGKRRLG